jgi:hypothetical protein
MTVSRESAQICRDRSPCIGDAAVIWSSGNTGIGTRCAGLRDASPYRASNSDAPDPTVTVSPSAGTTGPSVPLSAGIAWTSSAAAVRPRSGA